MENSAIKEPEKLLRCAIKKLHKIERFEESWGSKQFITLDVNLSCFNLIITEIIIMFLIFIKHQFHCQNMILHIKSISTELSPKKDDNRARICIKPNI